VKDNGRASEVATARLLRRPAQDLFHAALEVTAGKVRHVSEVARIPDGHGPRDRGVVGEGPVGARRAGRLRIFRYEIRRWPSGDIPDRAVAVDSPRRLAADEEAGPSAGPRAAGAARFGCGGRSSEPGSGPRPWPIREGISLSGKWPLVALGRRESCAVALQYRGGWC
jgi:hypothetical protein